MYYLKNITKLCVKEFYIPKIFFKKLCSTEAKSWPKKIFSGIQPTGAIHLGNYLGAIRKWTELQEAGEDVTISIVDLHSITMPQDPAVLRQNILNMAASLLACGIDPLKSHLFVQSSVRQHTELSWILGCLTTMARLSHLPQYKEKSIALKEIPLGLFVYPVLQAADIMLYKATHVPVGEDQVQHLQLAQHLAKLFNYKFGVTFPQCHAITLDGPASRIKSLRDPLKKMSKSDKYVKSCVFLMDSPDQMLDKIKKAVTDFTPQITYDPVERPGVSNLVTIHSLVSGKTPEAICEEAQHLDTAKYKLEVADAVIAHMEPIRKRFNDLIKNPDHLVYLLDEGSEQAAKLAEQTVQEVKERVGLGAAAKFMIPAKLVNEL